MSLCGWPITQKLDLITCHPVNVQSFHVHADNKHTHTHVHTHNRRSDRWFIRSPCWSTHAPQSHNLQTDVQRENFSSLLLAILKSQWNTNTGPWRQRCGSYKGTPKPHPPNGSNYNHTHPNGYHTHLATLPITSRMTSMMMMRMTHSLVLCHHSFLFSARVLLWNCPESCISLSIGGLRESELL